MLSSLTAGVVGTTTVGSRTRRGARNNRMTRPVAVEHLVCRRVLRRGFGQGVAPTSSFMYFQRGRQFFFFFFFCTGWHVVVVEATISNEAGLNTDRI